MAGPLPPAHTASASAEATWPDVVLRCTPPPQDAAFPIPECRESHSQRVMTWSCTGWYGTTGAGWCYQARMLHVRCLRKAAERTGKAVLPWGLQFKPLKTVQVKEPGGEDVCVTYRST
jgi:hypothetical protein